MTAIRITAGSGSRTVTARNMTTRGFRASRPTGSRNPGAGAFPQGRAGSTSRRSGLPQFGKPDRRLVLPARPCGNAPAPGLRLPVGRDARKPRVVIFLAVTVRDPDPAVIRIAVIDPEGAEPNQRLGQSLSQVGLAGETICVQMLAEAQAIELNRGPIILVEGSVGECPVPLRV